MLEVLVEGIDQRGRGVGHFAGHSVRVRSALPGARVRAAVQRRRGTTIEATVAEVVEPSRLRVEPRCPHFGTCGGCSLQDLDYRAQLAELGALLARTLGPLDGGTIAPVVGCDDPWHYRNKMDFTFATRRWVEPHEPPNAPNGFALGLHVPGRFDKVLDITRCDIAFVEAAPIVVSAREIARKRGLEPWDVRAHRGLLRHLVLRKSFATGQIMAVLVTTEADVARVEAYAGEILARHPEISTFVQLVNQGVAMVATGTSERILSGAGRIEEKLDGLRFALSARTFFQTNTRQAERLLSIVREEAAVEPGSVALDLYCGCGPLTLALARDGARAVGFELVETAVQDARDNADRNGVTDAHFVAGDLSRTLSLDRLRGLSALEPAVCVVDPPRAGLHPRVVSGLRRLTPRRIVYVSCNPQAAVRDMAPLCASGYRLVRARPVDLFPHTPHLECVLTLERNPA